MPLISFVAPVMSKAAWIGETIDSMRRQTLEDIEMLFIDDGSTDATVEVIEWFQSQDKRIRLIKLPKNVGLGKAWNIGVREAKAPIICVASGDDVFVPKRAEIAYKAFKKPIDVHYGAFWFTDYKLENVQFKPVVPFNAKKLLTPRKDGYCPQSIGHISMAFTKRIGLKVQHREAFKVGIDYPFICDLIKAKARFGWTKEVLAYARILNTGVSHTRREEVNAASVV